MSKNIPGHRPAYLNYSLHIKSKVQTFDHKEVFDVSSHALQSHALAIIESNQPNKISFSLTSKEAMNDYLRLNAHSRTLSTRVRDLRRLHEDKASLGTMLFVGVARASVPCG